MITEKEIRRAIRHFGLKAEDFEKKGKYVDGRIEREFGELLRWVLEEEQDTWDNESFEWGDK